MKKSIAILVTSFFVFLGTQTSLAEDEKIHVAPGMIVRVWGDVQPNLQAPNAPAGGGCVDLTDEMSTKTLEKNASLDSVMNDSGTYHASEWSGFLKVPAEGKYVMVIESSSRFHHGNDISNQHIYVCGKKIVEIKKTSKNKKETKTCELTLPAGFVPVSFFSVDSTRVETQIKVKLRPVDELDTDYLRVTDFYYKKKQAQ